MKKTFKHIITVSLFMALLLTFSTAGAQVFDKGDIAISAGLGLGRAYGAYGPGYKTTMPLIFVNGDYCLLEDLGPGNLGVGAYFGYAGYKYEYNDDWYIKYGTIFIGVRGTYHFVDLVDKLDLYGGLFFGGRIQTAKYSDPDYENIKSATPSGVGVSIFAGAKYYFTDNIGVMAELGYGTAWLSLGATIKF